MQWYHRIIFLLGQTPSCNTPKGTLKSSFQVEYKSVNFEMANDAQNGIFKTSFCREASCQTAVSVAEGIRLVSTISHIGFYIYCSTSPGMFLSCPQKRKNKGLLDFPLGQIPSTPGYSDVLKAVEETYGKSCLRTSLCHMRLPHLLHSLFSW